MSRKSDSSPSWGSGSVSGMSDVDAFVGTGLESINDSSSRWALPFTVGVRVRF